jgi:hypothetical protein
MIKECMIEGTFEGNPLPSNVFWAGAINPAGVSADGRRAQFVVRELPTSLEQLVLDYATLSPKQEHEFLHTFVKEVGIDIGAIGQGNVDAPQFAMHLVEVTLEAQQFVRSCNLDRIHVSVRDLLRVTKLYQTLVLHRSLLLPDASANGDPSDVLWAAIVVSVSLAYQLRLPVDARFALRDIVDRKLVELRCPLRWHTQNVMEQVLTKVYAATDIPAGIARTAALMENIYACVSTLLAGVPLNITGPPGELTEAFGRNLNGFIISTLVCPRF